MRKADGDLFRLGRAAVFVAALLAGIFGCARKNESPGPTIAPPVKQEFGGATQELEDRGEYVYCKVTGKGTVVGGVQGMRQVFKYADDSGTDRILLNLWDADVAELSAGEVIAGTFGLLPFWDWGTRISVCMPKEMLPTLVNRFSFPEGRIRLIKLRRFDTMEEAEAWLMTDE